MAAITVDFGKGDEMVDVWLVGVRECLTSEGVIPLPCTTLQPRSSRTTGSRLSSISTSWRVSWQSPSASVHPP